MKTTRALPLPLILCLSLACATAVAREDGPKPPTRVVAPPGVPGDSRLRVTHDVDHPWPFDPHFEGKEPWERRRQELRTQILVAEGLWPLPEQATLDPVIHGGINRDGYRVEKVFFASTPGHYVSGNLYRPEKLSGKCPAVLCPHGHWPNGRFMEASEADARKQMEIGAERTMEGARYPLQARCSMLARMGCVVFHYDMVGYADSKPIEHRVGFADAEALLRLQSTMGLQTLNSLRALDFLASLPEVDPRRIAVTGASGGGTQAFLLGAIDDRLAVSFPAVMVSAAMQGGCICENSSGLRVRTNNVEFAALFAPRPQGMTGANDWTKEIETKGLPELKRIYSLYDASDAVMARYFSFDHNYNQVSRELMYNWMNKHLALGRETPVKEQPFVPIPPGELSVYDARHPRPADAADAPALRERLAEASDAQMSGLANEPAEYRKVVLAALRALVVDDLPGRGEVEATHETHADLPGNLTLVKALLGRKGEGEAVPFVILKPEGWDGSVVLWVHPDGKSSLFGRDGTPSPLASKLLSGRSAIASADLFLTGEYVEGAPPATAPADRTNARFNRVGRYAGSTHAPYAYGYDRSLLGNRIHDLLSLVRLVEEQPGVKSIRLVAFGKAGPCALLARALSGTAIDRAAIDLDGFDFDQVTDPSEEMMLPGALKYGGIYGFVPLCDFGRTTMFNARKTGTFDRAAAVKGVTLNVEKSGAEELVAEIGR